jgi:anti-sigma factor RsiW
MSLNRPHLPFARLADLAEGRLTGEDERAARAHVAECAACAEQSAQLAHLTSLMRADTSEDAPRDVLLGAVGLFRARRASREESPGLLRRIVAALTFDSSSLTPAFGVRSGLASPARQLLFSAGDFDVDLRLAAGGEGWTVSGQVLGPCDGGEVEVEGGAGAGLARASLNDLCEFTLPPVPEGVYTLRLRVAEVEVEIPELSLRA